MNSTCTCGCCEGIAIAVPQNTTNRPGLPTLAYRVGTHATFLETMIARLSSQDFPALAALRTRDAADPSIALLDSWALVADVLTFYQERIANEGYLRTATERRSILELARLIGYKLRPGVAATVYLAYTLDEDRSQTPPAPTKTLIPAGARSQSVPGPGQLPQSFETSDDLDARSEWNNLLPRLSRPQLITANLDFETDATTRDTIYFSGVSTDLKTGDALLVVFGDSPITPVVRLVESVTVQRGQNRTEAALQEDPNTIQINVDFTKLSDFLTEFHVDATTVYSGSNLSAKLAALLQSPKDSTGAAPGLLDIINSTPPPSSGEIVDLLQTFIGQLQEIHDLAAQRHFTRLEPWLAKRLSDLSTLAEEAAKAESAGFSPKQSPTGLAASSALVPSPLGNLDALVSSLSIPPSIQPRSSAALVRSVTRAFSAQSDLAPKLLSAFNPVAASTLYAAWGGFQTPSTQVEVYALRAKATLFASSFAGTPNLPAPPVITARVAKAPGAATSDSAITVTAPTLDSAWDGTFLSLDTVYDKITCGSWVAIQFADPTNQGALAKSYHQVAEVRTASMQSAAPAPGFAAKVTQIRLNPPWSLPDSAFGQNEVASSSTAVLRSTVVYAQAGALALAEEPLDIDIEGDTIELDGIYDGLESGRRLIVSGVRTDIPNVSGVTASELVMVAAVNQGSRTLFCSPWPFSTPPFTKILFVTAANQFGDRLVVGIVAPGFSLSSGAASPNQQYCDQVELAPGFWVNAYVPTQAEINGTFSDFEELLIDPNGDLVQLGSLDKALAAFAAQPGADNGTGLWGWRISSAAVNTSLKLANQLAYSYDINTVTIYGNVVKATHGETRKETLGNGDGSQSFQQFKLKQKPLTFVPASNPAGTDTTLKVYVNEIKWQETDTLAGLGPKDREYVTQTADDDTTSISFGNGRQGARLPTGNGNVTALYRSGIGQSGNVDAGQISLLQTRPLNVKAVVNPLRASGGADRDSRDQARRNAPLAVMALDRLVSIQDYADFARTFAGIGKSSAVRLSDGQRDLVHVTVAGEQDIPIDYSSDLYQNLAQALQVNGDPYLPLEVAVRRLRLMVVSASVKILPDYLWEPVATAVRSALLSTFSFDHRDLGQPAFRSEAISVIQAVAGVAYVDMQKFDSVPEGYTAAQLADLATLLKLKECIPASLASPNPQPLHYPDDAILAAELLYLSSAIPDTLILNEVKS